MYGSVIWWVVCIGMFLLITIVLLLVIRRLGR